MYENIVPQAYTHTSLAEFAVFVRLCLCLPGSDVVEVETCGTEVSYG